MATIIVCGGRHFNDVARLWKGLDELNASLPEPHIRLVIDGASDEVTGPYVGGDYWGHQWSLARNIPHGRLHAKWAAYGKAAGPMRNAEMLTRFGKIDFVVAAPGGRGTADMIAKAKAAGVPVIEV